MKIAIRTITPPMAAEMLSQNDNNRPVRDGTVAKYARDMASGKWRLTGDPIRLNGKRLFDGQHRLFACIKADVPFETVVVEGLDESVLPVLDSGAKRTMNDVLRWRGESQAALLGAALRFVWEYENGVLRDPKVNASHDDLLGTLDENPGIRASVKFAANICARVKLRPASVAGVHYLASRDIDPHEPTIFFEQVASGAGLPEGSPCLALRRWTDFSTRSRYRLPSIVYAAVTIKGLNAWLNGQEVQILKWTSGGSRPDKFPVIGGNSK